MKSNLIDIACELIRETANAYCITDDGRKQIWLPKSQCQWEEDGNVMVMPEWLAKDKGLI